MKAPLVLAALLFCIGCTNPVVNDSNSLPRSTPEAQGISSAGILDFLNEIDRLNERKPGGRDQVAPEFHSLMILRNGHVVAEGWWEPYSADRKHALFSLSKSFTSTAAGFAIEEGFFNLDDPVISFFPEKRPDTPSPNLSAMTVRHLLTMSTGQSIDDRTSDDWVHTFLNLPVEKEPGSTFRYSTSATFMVSAIIQETTGQTVMEYLQPRFFGPLGIVNIESLNSPMGYNTGGYGKSATTEDIARLGQFYLQKGMWNNKQLLPASWVDLATSKQIENASDPSNPDNSTNDWAQGYGFQFWQTTHNAYRGDGAYGQFCLVIPEFDLVVAITGGSPDMQGMLNVLWDKLYPAIKEAPINEDEEAYMLLQSKLADLSLSPSVDQPEERPDLTKTFDLSENPVFAQRASYLITDESLSLSIEDSTGTHTSTCGFRNWTMNQTSSPLFPDNILSRALPDTLEIASMCQWVDDNTIDMTWRLINTPRSLSIITHFEEDHVRIERSWFNSWEGADLILEGELVPSSLNESE